MVVWLAAAVVPATIVVALFFRGGGPEMIVPVAGVIAALELAGYWLWRAIWFVRAGPRALEPHRHHEHRRG